MNWQSWIGRMDFLWPENFILLGFIPFLIYWYVKNNNKKQASLSVSTLGPFPSGGSKVKMRHLPFILRLLSITALIFALARPQKRDDLQHTQGDGIDIILCMDVSGSMGSRDILPSRMEVAKQVAKQFVLNRPVDRIGLVIFSGESFAQCPLTTDRNALIHQIQSLESRRYLKDGTVIGEGLATAVGRLAESKNKSKVIILITDGKEDAPDSRLVDPYTALQIAKAEGVKVYTIGMGARSSDIQEIKGRPRSPAIDFIDEALLQQIADQTGGLYFRAKDKEALQNIYNRIDQMEKSKVEYTAYKHYEELFFPFIYLALLFLFLEWVLRMTTFKKFP